MHIKRNGELLLAREQDKVRSYNIFTKNVKVFPVNRPDQQSRTATYIESLMLHTQGIDCSSSAKDQPEPPLIQQVMSRMHIIQRMMNWKQMMIEFQRIHPKSHEIN